MQTSLMGRKLTDYKFGIANEQNRYFANLEKNRIFVS
jgi:hypothetical protein